MARGTERDLYKDLDVPRDASLDTIKAAWLEAAFRYHPDTHDRSATDKEAAIKFQYAREAYRILSDPQARGEYDRRTTPQGGLGSMNAPYKGFADLPQADRPYRPIYAEGPTAARRFNDQSSEIIERALAAAREKNFRKPPPPLVRDRLLTHAQRKARRVARVEPRSQTLVSLTLPIVMGVAWVITMAKVASSAPAEEDRR